ncbi:hypothetical protein EMIHUDRAFT_435934 [Emiliania huxleyi CCMP1516]|uniref:Uncharacterized protein n=2 Tax=Emiliania huxleyi TaxID=2903 RepID=A0A0D3J8X6_EMIH1|nr:hypothetical protein EMIHUDRAFT_435934 [Emiliania huxleyi CCMP1516]EOD19961.1 hypothetical protein EMIHUDRAFT_435934 [Emiliania huxleyi CCMP1516]|eukprot:XP_005772390.1 hypothetical protein EMIHUDRAFT_435934 [Emiliania huxleyi CCMP1516]
MDAPPILSARLRSRFHCRAQPDARRGEAPRGFRTVQSRCAKGHDPGANVQVWDAHASTLPPRLGSLTGGDQSGRLPHVLLLCNGADIAGHRRQLLGHGQGPGLPRRQLCWRGHGRTGRAGRGRARPMRGRALRARRETSVPAEGARGHLWGAPALSAGQCCTRDGCSPRILLLTHGAVVWHRHVDSSSPRFEVAGDASSQPVSFRLSLSAAESSEACSLAVAPVWTAMLLAMLLGMLCSRQTRW